MTQALEDLTALQNRIRMAPGKLIGSRIRQARRSTTGMSHDKLAAATGTSRSHLIKLEKAVHRPGAAMLVAIAQALDKPVDFFLLEVAGEPNPFPDKAA